MDDRSKFKATLACLMACVTITAAAQTPADLDAKARAIHRRILVIDSHTDVLLASTPENLYAPGHTSHTDLDKLKKGGVGGVAMAIAVGNGPRTAEGVAAARAEADAKLVAIRAFLTDHPDQAALALSANDIVRIHKAGKVAVIESFLNTHRLVRTSRPSTASTVTACGCSGSATPATTISPTHPVRLASPLKSTTGCRRSGSRPSRS